MSEFFAKAGLPGAALLVSEMTDLRMQAMRNLARGRREGAAYTAGVIAFAHLVFWLVQR
jgi:hypothetical protein